MWAITQYYNWNDFSAWEWDAFYYWPRGSFKAWINVAVRELENAVRISSKKVDTEKTYQWEILTMNPFREWSFITQEGQVIRYYEWNNYEREIKDSEFYEHKKILWFGQLTKYNPNTNNYETFIYWFSAITNTEWWVIWRLTPQRVMSILLWKTRKMWVWKYNPTSRLITLSIANEIYWWYGNTIHKIDSNEIITQLLVLPPNADIYDITFYQDKFKIFYNVTNTDGSYDWYISYWDWNPWGDTTPLEQAKVKYQNSKIVGVFNDWPYDYVIFGEWNTSDLYCINGLNRGEPIRVNTEWSNYNSRTFWDNNMTNKDIWFIREWILYFVWVNKFNIPCIYSLWKYYPWSNLALIPESETIRIPHITNGKNTEKKFYIYDNWKIYTKSYDFDTPSDELWTIISYPITWNAWIFTIKTLMTVYVGYNLVDEWNEIKIYYRRNGWVHRNMDAWDFILLKTIKDKNKLWIRIDRVELTDRGLWDFYEMEFKVELVSPWNNKSPIFYWIRMVYSDNLKD